MKERKTVIDRRVIVIGVAKWRKGMERKATLNWCKTKRISKSELFYDGNWAGKLLFKARTKSLELNVRTYRWNENRQRMCMQCGLGVDETVEHMFLEYEGYANERAVDFSFPTVPLFFSFPMHPFLTFLPLENEIPLPIYGPDLSHSPPTK